MAQRRAIDDDAVAREDLRLPIQRCVVGVFRHEHVGHEGFCRDATFDQTRGGWRLHDTSHFVGSGFLTRATGVLRAPRHEHAQLRRNLVETLRTIFADLVQITTAAWTRLVRRLDHDLFARQVRRQMAAIGATVPDGITLYDVIRFFRFRILDSEAGLYIFECEVELVIARSARTSGRSARGEAREGYARSVRSES